MTAWSLMRAEGGTPPSKQAANTAGQASLRLHRQRSYESKTEQSGSCPLLLCRVYDVAGMSRTVGP